MTSPEAVKLKQVLDKLHRDIQSLKAGAAAPQLQNSSIEASEGRGYIPIMENGTEKHRVGRQPDGTFASISVNNLKPPLVPNRPICTPFIGGVTVSCDGFTGGQQYLDFSHINVYLDGQVVGTLMKVPEAFAVAPLDQNPHSFTLSSVNLSGTESSQSPGVIATANLVVGQDIADGIITTLKIANDAVTNAQVAANAITATEIADGSITTPKVVAQSITTALIATGAVQAGQIAAGAITSDKIVANAVTALQIAANAVTAGAIQAGSVTAQKLESVMVLASKIIAGSPTGKRLQLDSSGLIQTDNTGNIALQFGSNPQGNTLTVIDPRDPNNALATIGPDGSASFTGMSTNGSFTVNGVDLINYLNATPAGIVAYAITGNASPSTTSEVGWYELSFDSKPNRTYHIYSSPLYVLGDLGSCRVRYTNDGSTPTVKSVLLQEAVGSGNNNTRSPTSASTSPYDQPTGFAYTNVGGDGHNHGIGGHNHYMDHSHNTYYPLIPAQVSMVVTTTAASRIRLLFTCYSSYGASTQLSFIGSLGAQFAVEDIGGVATATGGTNAGSGTTTANGAYQKVYNSTWSRTFTYTGGSSYQPGYYDGQIIQGYDGTTRFSSMIGFDYASIYNDINNASNVKIELYLYANYWGLNSGGLACITSHNDRTSGGATSYTYSALSMTEQHLNKPQGMWIALSSDFVTQIKNNQFAGIGLNSSSASTGDAASQNLGVFRSTSFTDATVRPALRITYTK